MKYRAAAALKEHFVRIQAHVAKLEREAAEANPRLDVQALLRATQLGGDPSVKEDVLRAKIVELENRLEEVVAQNAI